MISIGSPSYKEETLVPIYKYKKISDDTSGTETTIWTPSSGKQIVLISSIISVDSVGTVELKDQTSGDTIAVLEFEAIKSVPFAPGFQILLPKDHALSAKFTVNTGTGNCYITIFGYER